VVEVLGSQVAVSRAVTETIGDMDSRYVDLSHRIEHEMVTFPGLPGPVVSTFVSREESAQRWGTGVSCHIGRVEMSPRAEPSTRAPETFPALVLSRAALLLQSA
jgi:hypothetical protein